MVNRTDITRWMTEYDPGLFPGYWHFPFTTTGGVKPAVNMGVHRGRHSISFTDPSGTTREVTGGPLLPGPRAEAFAKAGVIAANPEHGTWGEVKRNEAAGAEIHAKLGDELIIFGYVFTIGRAPNRNIRLDLTDGSNGLTAGEMRVIRTMTSSGAMTCGAAYDVMRQGRAALAPEHMLPAGGDDHGDGAHDD